MSKSSITTKELLPPVTPGMILKEFLNDFHLSAYALAQAIHVPVSRVVHILNGQRAVSADTALRLGRYFKTGARFWVNLQSNYDLELTSREKLRDIEATIRPIAS